MKTQYALIDKADDRVLATSYDRSMLVKLRDEFTFPERIRIWRRGVQPWMIDDDDDPAT